MPEALTVVEEKCHAMCRTVIYCIIRDMRARRKQLRAFMKKHRSDGSFAEEVTFIEGAEHELDHYISVVESALQQIK